MIKYSLHLPVPALVFYPITAFWSNPCANQKNKHVLSRRTYNVAEVSSL